MDMKLEVVELPVSDVDRSAHFYKALGWRLDADFTTGPDFRVVQMTPPGSACSVIFGKGLTTAEPGSARGISWVSFSDPDSNSWFVQEVTTRLPGRVTSAPAAAGQDAKA
jgi:catechol 2,3-dioxygenase-like lactoylglutathione lyase family enzyme